MKLECKVLEKVSKKGDKYFVLYVPELEKTIFLEPVEVKLLNVLYSNNK